MWNQVYNPFGNSVLSTIAAALPVVTLLVLIASGKVKAHIAAIVALIVANVIAIFIFTMPAGMSIRATILGALIWIADKLQSDQDKQARELWAARGKQAFDADPATRKGADRTAPAVRR